VSNSFLKPSAYTYNGNPLFLEDHRMYIRVKAGEVLYHGVHRILSSLAAANQADLALTVKYGAWAATQVQQTTLLRDQTSALGAVKEALLSQNSAAEGQMGLNPRQLPAGNCQVRVLGATGWVVPSSSSYSMQPTTRLSTSLSAR